MIYSYSVSRERSALITILADYPGGLRWNEKTKKRLRLAAMKYIGAKANKEQRDLMRAEIDILHTVYYSFGDVRLYILVATHTCYETGEPTCFALNPTFVESIKGAYPRVRYSQRKKGAYA